MGKVDSSRSPEGGIPVLFIAGSGRSGSTLLDRIIGMDKGFCSVGEIGNVWERSFRQNQLCGCGVPFHDCVFWNDVSRDAFGIDPSHFDAESAIALKEKVDRTRKMPQLVFSRRLGRYRSALREYGKLLEAFYASILRLSGARTVVDSSKNPPHGFILTRLPRFEVHVVHLVRDPRAVAFSSRRQRRRPEIHWKAEDMPVDHVAVTAARWVMHNVLAGLLSLSAASYCRVRYEDLITKPDTVMEKIMEPYEWANERPSIAEDIKIELESTHIVSGNPMRFAHGHLTLNLDDEWETAMGWRERHLVTLITLPLLLLYGYAVR
jgi:hypothetical protein